MIEKKKIYWWNIYDKLYINKKIEIIGIKCKIHNRPK